MVAERRTTPMSRMRISRCCSKNDLSAPTSSAEAPMEAFDMARVLLQIWLIRFQERKVSFTASGARQGIDKTPVIGTWSQKS